MNWIRNKLFLNQFRYYKILFVLKCSPCKYSTKNNVDRGVRLFSDHLHLEVE